MLAHFGRDAGMRMARKHVGWYSAGLPGSAEFRGAINRLADIEAARALIGRFYDELTERRFARPSQCPADKPSGAEEAIAWAA